MERSPEIEAIVRRLWSARTRGDREIIDGLWSRTEHLLIIGSDESEWIEGAEESLEVAGTQINEWLIEDSKLKPVVAYEAGSVGWAASEEERTSPNGRTSIFRRTMVFVLESGSWKIIQSHFSAPVPNIEATGVDMTRTLSELLDSVGDDDDLLPFAGRISGTVTLLFTDIVDSTQLDQEIGDLACRRRSNHFDTLRTLIEKHRGTVAKHSATVACSRSTPVPPLFALLSRSNDRPFRTPIRRYECASACTPATWSRPGMTTTGKLSSRLHTSGRRGAARPDSGLEHDKGPRDRGRARIRCADDRRTEGASGHARAEPAHMDAHGLNDLEAGTGSSMFPTSPQQPEAKRVE